MDVHHSVMRSAEGKQVSLHTIAVEVISDPAYVFDVVEQHVSTTSKIFGVTNLAVTEKAFTWRLRIGVIAHLRRNCSVIEVICHKERTT
ncbi:hypothetical protein KIN20_034244 [Parelaphostrongylus tenuis]|uniref:Uncharacterized protein n=1 Tax=Parelaphostrongylus tenuis TaxID=148309 RepID=A0AAD5R966_PARTN|nr:hypothetical protein KIN20_034244 [Parelaphostrongylus tenuis]